MKVFVVFGEPIIADIRLGSSEFSNIDYIFLDNKYLNWSKEYDLISKLAKDLSIDFFRIDFLYDGLKLFASECAFMPSTILPKKIEDFIYSKFSKPYSPTSDTTLTLPFAHAIEKSASTNFTLKEPLFFKITDCP